MNGSEEHDLEHSESLAAYALEALPADEIGALEARLAGCERCREELEGLRRVTAAFVAWPAAVLRPPVPLWDRLTRRIVEETGSPPATPLPWPKAEPEWEDAAPGIRVKILATDAPNRRVTMLVELAPGAEYPPHVHAGVEELFLLDGELRINERDLVAGDYSRGEPGANDYRVWSRTGCTCLLITSVDDVLG